MSFILTLKTCRCQLIWVLELCSREHASCRLSILRAGGADTTCCAYDAVAFSAFVGSGIFSPRILNAEATAAVQ